MAAVKRRKYLGACLRKGDIKAFPIMGACMKNIEEAGGKVSYGFVDGNASAAKQNRRMQEIAGHREPYHVYVVFRRQRPVGNERHGYSAVDVPM